MLNSNSLTRSFCETHLYQHGGLGCVMLTPSKKKKGGGTIFMVILVILLLPNTLNDGLCFYESQLTIKS